MSTKPSLVLIPGAWNKPACFDKITKLLCEGHGLTCVSVTLPSTTGNPAASLKDDIDAARHAIIGQVSYGRDVVVIAHSYGGLVGSSAIKNLVRPRETTSSLPLASEAATGHVIALILITSGYFLTGMSLMDTSFGRPPPSWRVNMETGFAELVVPPRELLFHDLPRDEGDYWVSQLTPHSLKSMFEGGEFAYAGWMDVPSWYIGASEDQCLSVTVQRMTVGMARAMGGIVQHRELKTSHSPFLCQPDETVQIIIDAIESLTTKRIGDASSSTLSESTAQESRIILPEPRFWRPRTWVKFGLPLLFGRVIGNCVLLFGWSRSWLRRNR